MVEGGGRMENKQTTNRKPGVPPASGSEWQLSDEALIRIVLGTQPAPKTSDLTFPKAA
jgi:hypothetical protein